MFPFAHRAPALGFVAFAAAATPASANPASGAFYETFASGTVAAFTLNPQATATAFLGDAATNIVATPSGVYFQDGNTIFSTSTSLVGLNTVVSTPGTPAGFAINPTAGILYETFGAGGVAAISLANTSQGLGVLNDTATNISFAGGHVYFQSGDTIYETSPTLVGLTPVITTPTAPTDFAIDPSDSILYETFGAGGVSAISLANTSQGFGNLNDLATNIVVGNGAVYFEDGQTIFETNKDLVGLTTFVTTGAAASGIALLPPQTIAATVPEPEGTSLLAAGLLALAAIRHRRLTFSRAARTRVREKR